MVAPLRLLQDWSQQLTRLVPAVRVTRLRGWLACAVAIALAESCALPRAARVLPGHPASTEKRLRRWLANEQVDPARLWPPVRQGVLARWAGREVVLVFDPTVHRGEAVLLVVSVVWGRRALPLAWRIASHRTPWPTALATLLAEVLAEVAADLPATAGPVTVLLDRGLAGPAVVDAVQACGMAVVVRLQAGAAATGRLRLADGEERRLAAWSAEVAPRPGTRWWGAAAVFKDAGWRAGWLTIWWGVGQREPLVLFSTRPGGWSRVREYTQRMRVEATYADAKRRGLRLDQSRITDPARLARLLLAWALAYWILLGLGERVVRRGWRDLVDRADRVTMARWRIGRAWLLRCLADHRPPPFPWMLTPAGPAWRWVL